MAHGVADPATAGHKAIVAIGARIQQQANIMAFSDTFLVLGAVLCAALIATALLKKTGQLDGGGAH